MADPRESAIAKLVMEMSNGASWADTASGEAIGARAAALPNVQETVGKIDAEAHILGALQDRCATMMLSTPRNDPWLFANLARDQLSKIAAAPIAPDDSNYTQTVSVGKSRVVVPDLVLEHLRDVRDACIKQGAAYDAIADTAKQIAATWHCWSETIDSVVKSAAGSVPFYVQIGGCDPAATELDLIATFSAGGSNSPAYTFRVDTSKSEDVDGRTITVCRAGGVPHIIWASHRGIPVYSIHITRFPDGTCTGTGYLCCQDECLPLIASQSAQSAMASHIASFAP